MLTWLLCSNQFAGLLLIVFPVLVAVVLLPPLVFPRGLLVVIFSFPWRLTIDRLGHQVRHYELCFYEFLEPRSSCGSGSSFPKIAPDGRTDNMCYPLMLHALSQSDLVLGAIDDLQFQWLPYRIALMHLVELRPPRSCRSSWPAQLLLVVGHSHVYS